LRWDAANAEKIAAQNRAWNENNEKPSPSHGLTRTELTERLVAQGGACAICRKTELKGQDLHGDHDHATGMFRGVLCRRCNTGIGMLGDTLDACRAAVAYLERHAKLQELL
jgi:hypothetical protein